jgi:hypothetical protein
MAPAKNCAAKGILGCLLSVIIMQGESKSAPICFLESHESCPVDF